MRQKKQRRRGSCTCPPMQLQLAAITPLPFKRLHPPETKLATGKYNQKVTPNQFVISLKTTISEQKTHLNEVWWLLGCPCQSPFYFKSPGETWQRTPIDTNNTNKMWRVKDMQSQQSGCKYFERIAFGGAYGEVFVQCTPLLRIKVFGFKSL